MRSEPTDQTTEAMVAELRELCRDVSGDQGARARRLALLRRIERRMAAGDAPDFLALA